MSLQSHLPMFVVLLPAITAVLLLWAGDGAARQGLVRALALASTTLLALLAALLLHRAASGALLVYQLGEWPAPFGIVLVVDRLAALMVALTAAVALPVLLYATSGWDRRGRHFHALFQFQLMGLAGAFVTGDLFNLFVFFEVMLIASYVLMLHGRGTERLRAGLHYVVLNLVASALFLVGVSLLYAVTGTLNLADLALRLPRLQGDDAALARTAAALLMVVFGFKAALLPLALWLPATYAATSAPVAALFAIMTKVGVYALWRVHGVLFGTGAGELERAAAPWLLPLALGSGVLGVLGAMASSSLQRLVAWLTVASVGTVLAGVGLFTPAGWAAALVYLVNSTLVVAALFLLTELLAAQRGPVADRLVPGTALRQPVRLGLALLLAAAMAAGLPPMPGFIGKLMLLQAAASHPGAVAVWAVVLVGGLLTLVGLARAGSLLVWTSQAGTPALAAEGPAPERTPQLALAVLLLMVLGLSVLAQPLQRYAAAAAAQLDDRAAYGRAVLGERTDSTRPYRFDAPQAAPSR